MRKIHLAFIVTISIVSLSLSCIAQENIRNKIERLKNTERVLYFDSTNKYYGAGMSLEGRSMNVVFYKAVFDRKSRLLTLVGNTYFRAVRGDTVSVDSVHIFVGQPKNKRIRNIRVLDYSYSLLDGDVTNKKDGDFSIHFRFKPGDRLYFSYPAYFLVEYNITKLLR